MKIVVFIALHREVVNLNMNVPRTLARPVVLVTFFTMHLFLHFLTNTLNDGLFFSVLQNISPSRGSTAGNTLITLLGNLLYSCVFSSEECGSLLIREFILLQVLFTTTTIIPSLHLEFNVRSVDNWLLLGMPQ
jgi:hypothetical protein